MRRRKKGSSDGRLRICLMDHMGRGNLGDAATQDSMLANLRRRLPAADFSAISMNPPDTLVRHGLAAFPIAYDVIDEPLPERPVDGEPPPMPPSEYAAPRPGLLTRVRIWLWYVKQHLRFLTPSLRFLRSLDVLVISGGGQFCDEWGGPWRLPFNVFRWTLLARLVGVRVWIVSVGAGPISTFWSRFFTRNALRLAEYRSLRDEESRTLVRAIGFRGSVDVYPDLGHSIPHETAAAADPAAPPTVAIGPYPHLHPRRGSTRDAAGYQKYVTNLAQFAAWLLARGYRVLFISNSAPVDYYPVHDVIAELRTRTPESTHARIVNGATWTVPEVLQQIGSARFVISSRFHGVLLSHVMHKPTIALSPHQKIDSLMATAGLAEYCLPIDSFDAEMLRQAFLSLEANHDRVAGMLRDKEAAYLTLADVQYSRLAALCAGPTETTATPAAVGSTHGRTRADHLGASLT